MAQLGVYELGCRTALWFLYDAALWPGEGIAYRFYPELRAVRDQPDAETLDILLLGASVLDQATPEIRRQARERFGPRVRIHGLAVSGHTSLDSWYKYRHLDHEHFDLVVVYHAINELRTNNAPPDEFRDDYSHYAWYALINLFERRDGWERSGLFVAANLAWVKLGARLGWRDFVPRHIPMEATMHYGDQIKSARPFERNLTNILDLAAARGDRVLLMTFASYVPLDYTHERFLERQLDYAGYEVPIRLWGLEENVVRGLAVHNAIVRDLATHRSALFVDQEAQIPKRGEMFVDICHLSATGKQLFAANLFAGIEHLDSTGAPGR